jgi:hypothetical protein
MSIFKKNTSSRGGRGPSKESGGWDPYDDNGPSQRERDKRKKKDREAIQRLALLITGVGGIAGAGTIGFIAGRGYESAVNQEALHKFVSPTATATELAPTIERTPDPFVMTELPQPSPTLRALPTELPSIATKVATTAVEQPSATPKHKTPEKIDPTATVKKEVTHPNEVKTEYLGVTFQLNKEGLPISYTLANGEKVIYTPQQLAEFKAARQKAVLSGELEVVDIFSTRIVKPQPLPTGEPSAEQPFVRELPPDAITNTHELSQLGVEIVNPSGADTPQLILGRGLFGPGGPFEALKIINENAKKPSDREEVMIVVIDDIVVGSENMKGPQYAPDIVKLLKEQESVAEQYRQTVLQQTLRGLEKTRADWAKKKSTASESDKELYRINILAYKQAIKEMKQKPASQILREMQLSDKDPDLAGLFVPHGLRRGDKVYSVIFTTTGNRQSIGVDQVVTTFDEFGQFQTETSLPQTYTLPQSSIYPDVSKSFPHKEQFQPQAGATEKNQGYEYGAQTNAGFTLRHEDMHWLLTVGLPKLREMNLLDKLTSLDTLITPETPQSNIIIGERHAFPNPNEFTTDHLAMELLQKAWQEHLEKGNNSLYGFYFQVPANEKDPGGYMLAKYEPNNLSDGINIGLTLDGSWAPQKPAVNYELQSQRT